MAALTNRLVPLTTSVSWGVFLPNSLHPPYGFEPAARSGLYQVVYTRGLYFFAANYTYSIDTGANVK